MSSKKGEVALTLEQRERLEQVSRSNKTSIRERKRARVLLLLDTGPSNPSERVASDESTAKQAGVCSATVTRTRARFCKRGLEGALFHKEQKNRKARVLDGEAEAHLIATVCSAPPDGRKRWSLKLIKDKLIALEIVDGIAQETIRTTLKKTNLNPG